MQQEWDPNQEAAPDGIPASDDSLVLGNRASGDLLPDGDRFSDGGPGAAGSPAAALPPAPSSAALPPPPRAISALPALKAQRRSRRVRFLAGLALILVPGSLWAGLSTDPVRQQNFDQFGGDVVFAAGPARAVMVEPAMMVTSEDLELGSGEEITIARRMAETSQLLVELDEGDQLVVTLASQADDFPPGYRSIIDLSVSGPDGSSGSSASVVFPDFGDAPALDLIVETTGDHIIELVGDFSPFSVDVTVARNPEIDVDGEEPPEETTDGEG